MSNIIPFTGITTLGNVMYSRANDIDDLPPDNVLQQIGEPTRAERVEMAELQSRSIGFLSDIEKADAQIKALGRSANS